MGRAWGHALAATHLSLDALDALSGLDLIVEELRSIKLGQQLQGNELRAIELGQQQLSARLAATENPTSPSESERGTTLLLYCSKRDTLAPSSEPPLLTPAELNDLHERLQDGKENAWVALVTRCLAALVSEASPSYVLVNSELIPWIHTPAEQPQFFQKPDLFACHRAALVVQSPPQVTRQSAASTQLAATFRDDSFVFGKCAWPLRTGVLCLFEAKLKIRLNHDVGEVFPKVQNLLRDTPLATAKCCLFDTQQLYLLEFTLTALLSLRSFAWTEFGSRAALSAFLLPSVKPVWLRVLDGVCAQLRVAVTPENAYLGHGATGLVFRVRPDGVGASSAGGAVQALKISRDATHIDSIALEVFKTRAVRECALRSVSDALSALPTAPSDAKLVLDVDSTQKLGAGFTFGPVGVSVASEQRSYALWLEVVAALLLLHRMGEVHGDPRLPNLLRVEERRLVWIDLRESEAAESPSHAYELDVQKCAASFFRVPPTDARLVECAKGYAALLLPSSTPDAFARCVWTALEPRSP